MWQIERNIAESGGGWDGLELGKKFRVYVVEAPKAGELTEEGYSRLPLCRMKDDDGHLVGRYIVTKVDLPVSFGQELIVLITGVGAKVVFATTKLDW